MAFINKTTVRYGYDFVPQKYLPPEKDEYWQRNRQTIVREWTAQGRIWRHLADCERETLIKNNNSCSAWDDFLVCDPFDPSLIRGSHFFGLVRIGPLRDVLLQHHDFCVPSGIRNSTVISSDIGADTAIQDCAYISHYIIGDNCILSRIDEMQTTNHAKFGNGVVIDGEEEELRVWIDVMNEAGGRSVLAFPDLLPADAFLWASYRDDKGLVRALKDITQQEYGGFRGTYGVAGSYSVIKSCRIIKDVFIGEYAYIKGVNKLKNITVLSSEDEPSQIGEGAELVNGIVGFGCHAFYGVKAVRFVMGRCSTLKYGARLIHSVLGDNSTVSCCEILNNLVFPFHEQHHNNSFLVASLIQGMSNMAAGATVGSNHNSRANDGEIRAGRGFWPGLSTTLKHSSRFAGFILVAHGDFPYELNITLPFSLVNNNPHLDRLEIMPAYFWMYNLYALERNSWKCLARERRKVIKQRFETDYLAPDTAEEIISALSQMEFWMKTAGMPPLEKTVFGAGNSSWFSKEFQLSKDFQHGNSSSYIEDPEYELYPEDETIPASGLERHHRATVVLKPKRALSAYREMLLYYSLKTLESYLLEKPELSYTDFIDQMEAGSRTTEWVNLGGQIVPAFRIDDLREKIRLGKIESWDGIHASYDEMYKLYNLDRARHAWEVYRYLECAPPPSGNAIHPLAKSEGFVSKLETLIQLRRGIAEQVFLSRAKDFNDPFRGITYRNKEEMEQVAGNAEDNSFVKLVRERTKLSEDATKHLADRLRS